MRKTSFPHRRTHLKSFNSISGDISLSKEPVLACLGSKLDYKNLKDFDHKAHTPVSSSIKRRQIQPSKRILTLPDNSSTTRSPSPTNSPHDIIYALQGSSISKLHNESPVIQLTSVPQRFETTPDVTPESVTKKSPLNANREKKPGLSRHVLVNSRVNKSKGRIDTAGLQILSFSPRIDPNTEESDKRIIAEKRVAKKSNIIQPISPIGSFSVRREDISKTNWSLLGTSSYQSNLETAKSVASPSMAKTKQNPESPSMKVLSSILYQPTDSYSRRNIKSQQQQKFWKDSSKTKNPSYRLDSPPPECATISNITPQNFLTEEFFEEKTKHETKDEINIFRQNISPVSFTREPREKKFLIPTSSDNIYELGDTSLYTIFEKKDKGYFDSQSFSMNPFFSKGQEGPGISLLKSIKLRQNGRRRKNSSLNNSGQIIVGSNFQKPQSPVHSPSLPKMRFKKKSYV